MTRWQYILVALLIHALSGPFNEAAAKTIRFKSVVKPAKWTATISGELIKPKGAGPFPAIVFMHSCPGLRRAGRTAQRSHARYMLRHGFASLLLDSFSSRGLNGGKVCSNRELSLVTANFRVNDAFDALSYLQVLPYISNDNIFLVGQSHGAIVALIASFAGEGDPIHEFRAVAAYYPLCERFGYYNPLKSPLIVFGAGRDDWTPPGYCKVVKDEELTTGAEFKVVIYPNALHGFDTPVKTRRYFGHRLGFNRAATNDSRKQMIDFFVKHLTKELKNKAN